MVRRAVFFLILTLAVPFAHGQDNERNPVDDLRLKIAVYGPSDEIFIWWGHAALIVENTRWNYSRVFDWGIFSYPSESFLNDFLHNDVQYRVTTGYLEMDSYIKDDRDITVYTLDLDRRAKEVILLYADNIVLPENCYYDYHEFKDNCSTGIRDILDVGTGGQFKAAFDSSPGRLTIRQHVRRYTWFHPLSDWVLDFLMGHNLDKKVTPWNEMFLPAELARHMVDFSYTDGSGNERKLVSSVEIIHASKTRSPILNKAPAAWPFALALGLFAAFLIFAVKALGRRYYLTGRIILGLLQGFFGLCLGGLGCVLIFGLFFMPNDYIQQNVNALFINPLLLAMVPLGVLSASGRFGSSTGEFTFRNPDKLLRILWTYVLIAGSVTLLFQFLPVFRQQNLSVLGIVLPVAFALSRPNTFRSDF